MSIRITNKLSSTSITIVLPYPLSSTLQLGSLDSLSGFLRSLPPPNLSTFKCAGRLSRPGRGIPDASSGRSNLPTVLQVSPRAVEPRDLSYSLKSLPQSFCRPPPPNSSQVNPLQKHGGEGGAQVFSTFNSQPPSLPKSFVRNTYRPPRKCCKQKTYGSTKPFRCNTYKKHGGRGPGYC
jgi:hypothetical protein